jgi:hypothetical protein
MVLFPKAGPNKWLLFKATDEMTGDSVPEEVLTATAFIRHGALHQRMLREEIRTQLRMIEQAYGITMVNADEVSAWIGEATTDLYEISAITGALNTYVAMAMPVEEITVPREIVDQLVTRIRSPGCAIPEDDR